MRLIRGSGDEMIRRRALVVRRLLDNPESVSKVEAREFLSGIAADFQAFVKREQLRRRRARYARRKAVSR
jgi:hypothetical protein